VNQALFHISAHQEAGVFDDLRGKVAVVTGGGRGLGHSLAGALAADGSAVGLLDVLPDVVDTAAALGDQHGVPALGVVTDVRDPKAVEAAFASVTQALGVPDVLVAAAGITIWGDSVDVEPETWQRVIDINLSGTFYACQSFGRRALPEGKGSVILISSMSAQIVNVPQFQASYHATKAGVSMLGQALAVEWASKGIRVNAIAPGYMLSEMTRQFTDANPDLARQWTNAIPLGRMGQPQDLHGLVGFLASDASAYLTAQTIVIDGGYTAL
jgi:NAD(P)-dependent dehydrogenase (short-subunit alcohol dehydrogenase family)